MTGIKVSIMLFLTAIIAISGLTPVFASSQLDITIDPDAGIAVAKMTYQRSITFDYSQGGKLADALVGKSDKIAFSASSDTVGMTSLIGNLNSYMASKGSQAQITEMDLDYLVTITGRSESASIDYKIVLKPTIKGFIIKEGSGNAPTLIDVDWRGFGALGPVVITTPIHGDVEINLPISAIQTFIPSMGLAMQAGESGELLTTRLMDGDGIKEQPIGNWHFLFDPTGIGVDAAQYGFQTGSVLSSFTMGESSLREGLIREQIHEVTFNSDKVYVIKSVESSANASIDILGFANRDTLGDSEIFGVTPNAPEGYASTSSGEFPAFILYGMAGMAAIGGVAMMLMSKRKLSKEKGHYQQTGIDPTQLTGVQTSASSGGYQTVRGEAHLKGGDDYEQHRSYYDDKPQVEEKSESTSKKGAMPKGFKPNE
jgi:hypothetical protein